MNDAELPLVSICIPTYNRAERLRRAVQRALEGDYPNLDIVISDNGSTDHTQEVAADLCAAHPCVRYFRHPVNRGPTANFEFARSQAQGRYFLWHGDDDYLAPDYILRCVTELERDPSLILASGVAAYHRGDQVVTRFGNVIDAESRSPWVRTLLYLFTVEENSIFCGAYRRDQVADCTFPDVLSGDWAWMAEVLWKGRARVIPEAHVFREESDNTSSSTARVVAVLGAPAWQGRFSWLAIPLNVAGYLAFRSAAMRGRPWAVKCLRWAAVFSLTLFKLVLIIVGTRIPYAGRLYRAVFGRRTPAPPGT